MKKLLSLDPNLIQTGLFSGVGEAAVPLWSDGENIVFKDLGIRRIKGADKVLNSQYPSTIRALLQGYSAGKQRVYIGNDTKLSMLERTAGVWANTDLHTWTTASDYQQLETWGNWLIGTNNVDPPVVWKNAGLAAAIAGIPFTRAKILRRRSPYLLAFNTSNGEDKVEWCDTSNIEAWAPGSGGAGNNTIRDLESEIVAAELLGDRIGVYSTSGMAIGTYVGSPNWWGFKKAIEGIGAVSPKSIVTQGVFQYGLMQNGIFVTDGNSSRFIDDPMMKDWLVRTVNWDQAKYIWGFHDDYHRAITWHFLDVDLFWRSISYHYDSKLLTRGSVQLTAGAPRASLELPSVADVNRYVGHWQKTDTHMGLPIEYWLQSKPLDFGNREIGKILQMVKVDGQWSEGNDLKIGVTDHPEGTVEWIHEEALTQHNYIKNDREAPYFVIQFTGDAPVYITGIEFYGVPGGVWI